MECCVTNPFSPSEPSSVVRYTRPRLLKLFNSSKSFLVLAPSRNTGSIPSSDKRLPKYSKGAVPTPPPTNRIFFVLSSGIVKPLPRGSTQFNLSPTFNFAILRVPAPIVATNNHSSLCHLSTKLMEMGRRRYVVGESVTCTSTNCPGIISGSGVLPEVNLMSTYRSCNCSIDVTSRSRIYFFIDHTICFFLQR